ncbi:MAG: sugar ABC transporter substrate-binding protein [Acidimicrobiia bacterium]|nr:sugar ABC transporter substrate-binding protein [Actinomycetota bacterium]MBL6925194.1 sugar ABC transporter substrate-binding protein [Acidimicrobiia bacterium]
MTGGVDPLSGLPDDGLVTAANVGQFEAQWGEAPPLPVAAPESYEVAYLSASSANTWLLASREEMDAVAAGANVTITEFDAQFNPELQTTQIQDAIASGQYDGLVVVALIGPGLAPDIEAALDAGLEVVVLNQVVGTDLTTADPQVDGLAASVMAPPQRSGERMGALAVQACEGIDPCRVVFIYGIRGIPLDDALKSGFDSAIADHAHISVVAEGEGMYLGPQGGMNAIQDIMQATPEFDVVVGADQSIQGIEIVLEEEGMLDSVKLIGLGGSAAAIEGISSGTWFGGVYGAPGDEGRYAMEAMIAALRDGTVTGGIDPAQSLPDEGLVTADNVSQFEAQWEG